MALVAYVGLLTLILLLHASIGALRGLMLDTKQLFAAIVATVAEEGKCS